MTVDPLLLRYCDGLGSGHARTGLRTSPHDIATVTIKNVGVDDAGARYSLYAVRLSAESKLDQRKLGAWFVQRDTLAIYDGLSAVKADKVPFVAERRLPTGSFDPEKSLRQLTICVHA